MSLFRVSSECSQTEIVAELRRAYWMFRGRDEPYHASPDWEKLAKHIKDRAIVPSRYVRWAYMQIRITQHTPWIRQITSDGRVTAFLKAEKEYIKMEILRLKLRLKMLHQRLAAGATVQQVVADEWLDLGDAVRYAAARKAGMTDSAERLRRGAELDLLNEPVYMSLLSSFLG